MTKRCYSCGVNKPITEFSKNRTKKDGLQEYCKPCRSAHHQLKWKHRRPKATTEQKRRWLLSSYGLTTDSYNALLKAQSNRCAICHSTDWGKPSPSIDHCHITGRVRGLLCNRCNRAMGMFRDNTDILFSAMKYLWRNGLKDGQPAVQDLEKAVWYIQDEIKRLKQSL